jgi:Family of unknown function (DUF6338)
MNGFMFGGFEAALAFLLLVMPGLLLIAGYHKSGRTPGRPDSPLESLAQAVAWSIFLLAPAVFILGDDLARWSDSNTVKNHVPELARWTYGTLFIPFLLGLFAGWLAGRWPFLAKLLGPRGARTTDTNDVVL